MYIVETDQEKATLKVASTLTLVTVATVSFREAWIYINANPRDIPWIRDLLTNKWRYDHKMNRLVLTVRGPDAMRDNTGHRYNILSIIANKIAKAINEVDAPVVAAGEPPRQP
jgi:hypothetical protein